MRRTGDDLAKQNNRNRRAGARWEADLERHLREKGFTADRTRNSGTQDQGDVMFYDETRRPFVVEAKNCQQLNLSGWLNEATVEAINWSMKRPNSPKAIPVVFIKRRNSGIGRGYALMEIDRFLELLGGSEDE